MSFVVEPSILPGECAARTAVGRESHACRIAITPIGLGADADWDEARLRIRFAREYFYCRKILTVIERELRA